MSFTGTIKEIRKSGKGKNYAYITPDIALPEHEGPIRFFEDKLLEASISGIIEGDVVDFQIFDWQKRDGTIEKLAGNVRLIRSIRNEALSKEDKSLEAIENSLSFEKTGTISWIDFQKGKGYIKLDNNGEEQGKEIIFFTDNLDLSVERLEKDDRVEFSVQSRKTRNGLITKIARNIKLLSKSSKKVEDLEFSSSQAIDVKVAKEAIVDFASNVMSISDAAQFEDYVFLLLRLLGIHKLYQYDKKNQAGRADGFFIIGSLVVMYDCTLRSHFEDNKKDQLENYVNKLKRSEITIEVRQTDGGTTKKKHHIETKNRQVWVITQGRSRGIMDIDGAIYVKEVSVKDLIRLLKAKLYSDTFEEEDLSARLAIIDKTID